MSVLVRFSVLPLAATLLFANLTPSDATTCATVAACVLGDNTSSGAGIEGEAVSGNGVYGISKSSHGVLGTSSTSFGVEGTTAQNSTSANTARAGVYGNDVSSNHSIYNSGVGGRSSYGIGVLGETAQGVGLEGLAVSNSAYTTRPKYSSIGVYGDADGGPGIYGFAHGTAGDSYGVGASADQPGITSLASFAGGDKGSSFYAITHADGFLMVGESYEHGHVMTVDGEGNMTLAGTLTQNGSPEFRTQVSGGSNVTMYGQESSVPTVEDLGEARLQAGAATVRLAKTFISAIDPSKRYMVFITPEGDSRGLFVAQQTSNAFVVRENSSGRSTLSFNYRIVAKPFGLDKIQIVRHSLEAFKIPTPPKSK